MSKKNLSPVLEADRFFSKAQPDFRSRESLVKFLLEHYRYSTMSGHNQSTSYANCVKINRLGLTSRQEDSAYSLLEVDDGLEFANYHIADFTKSQNSEFTAGFNGRSGGYLVLYRSQEKKSEHKSICRCCGQRNFCEVADFSDACAEEKAIANLVLSRNNLYGVPAHLETPELQALNLSDQEKAALVNKWTSKKKWTTLDNKCGRCLALARVPFSRTELVVWPGKHVDMDADFEDLREWTFSRLKARAQLVVEFDEMCDRIRQGLIALGEEFEVVDETILVPRKRKVLREREVA